MEKELKVIVKEKYAAIAKNQDGCCGPKASSCCEPEVETAFSESYQGLEGYVADADLSLGCGIPTEFAQIQKGDAVLDLGSGAGNDVFVARSLTGDTGRVIGVDMTEEMIAKAEQNRRKLGYENVEFRLGDIEELPLADNLVDVAISNCVMNLVPNKEKAYSEVYRVLKPGGHFSISDIVIVGDLPAAAREAAALYAGCVSGAMQKEDYVATIRATGFRNVQVQKERLIELPDDLLLQHLQPEDLEDFRRSGSSIYSINVFAEK